MLSWKRDELIRFGTPFLYGFREKYDDPFQFSNGQFAEKVGKETARAFDYSLPWQEFNDLAAQICREFAVSLPFESASIQNISSSLLENYANETGFVFSFASKEGCAFFIVAGTQYFRLTISVDALLQYRKALFEYQRANTSVNRIVFQKELGKLAACLHPVALKIQELVETTTLSKLNLVCDFLTEGIPIIPSLIQIDALRLKMKERPFVVKTCQAFCEVQREPLAIGPVVCISNSEDNLEMANSEKAIVKRAFEGWPFFDVDLAHQGVDFSQPPSSTSYVLHLATHSLPANFFTDPFFVSTGAEKKNSIWLESIQREAHRLQLRLVFLNGCNTGTTANWNYFRAFKTSEKVGLTSAFLLNMRCGVVATQWNETDIVAYTFSLLFYKQLLSELNPERSFTLALIDLFELTKDDSVKLFQHIIEEPIRAARCAAVLSAKTDFPFRNPFCLGMFQFFSLLSDKSQPKAHKPHSTHHEALT